MNKIKNSFKIENLAKGITVFIIFCCSRYFILIPIKLFNIDIYSINNEMKVYLSTFASFILFFIFLLIYRLELKKEFKTFKDNFIECMDIGVRWWLIGLFLMIFFNFIITHLLHGGGAGNEQQVQTLVKAVPWIMLFDAGFLAPVNEEIVFRKTLKDIFTNKWIFALASFLLFGGAHIIGNIHMFTDILYIFPYGVLGAVFALAYYESDTIFTTISMHMIHNIILVLMAIFFLS